MLLHGGGEAGVKCTRKGCNAHVLLAREHLPELKRVPDEGECEHLYVVCVRHAYDIDVFRSQIYRIHFGRGGVCAALAPNTIVDDCRKRRRQFTRRDGVTVAAVVTIVTTTTTAPARSDRRHAPLCLSVERLNRRVLDGVEVLPNLVDQERDVARDVADDVVGAVVLVPLWLFERDKHERHRHGPSQPHRDLNDLVPPIDRGGCVANDDFEQRRHELRRFGDLAHRVRAEGFFHTFFRSKVHITL